MKDDLNIYIDVPYLKTGGVEMFGIFTGISLKSKGLNCFLIESPNERSINIDLVNKIESKVPLITKDQLFTKIKKQEDFKHIIITSWDRSLLEEIDKRLIGTAQLNRIEIIGYVHSDATYYYDFIKLYEPIISKFICVSEAASTFLRLMLPKREEDIYHQKCPTTIQNHSHHNSFKDRIKLIFVGRIEDNSKGVFQLPLICKELQKRKIDFELKIVGNGPDLLELKKRINNVVSNDNIVFVDDAHSPKDVKEHFEGTNLLLITSNYEGGPIVLYESMACKVIPVAFPVGNVRDVIDNGKNGFIVENSDYIGLVDIIEYIEKEPSILKSISERSFSTIKELGMLQSSYDDFLINLVKKVENEKFEKQLDRLIDNKNLRSKSLEFWIRSVIPERILKQYQIPKFIRELKENKGVDTNSELELLVDNLQKENHWYRETYETLPKWTVNLGKVIRKIKKIKLT